MFSRMFKFLKSVFSPKRGTLMDRENDRAATELGRIKADAELQISNLAGVADENSLKALVDRIDLLISDNRLSGADRDRYRALLQTQKNAAHLRLVSEHKARSGATAARARNSKTPSGSTRALSGAQKAEQSDKDSSEAPLPTLTEGASVSEPNDISATESQKEQAPSEASEMNKDDACLLDQEKSKPNADGDPQKAGMAPGQDSEKSKSSKLKLR